jgi:hypothetical protein
MISFAYYATLTFIVTLVWVSGMAHLLRLAHFDGVLQAHSLIPRRLTLFTASAVTALEWGIGLTAMALLLNRPLPVAAMCLHTACLLSALAFTVYVRRLLHTHPEGIGTCGCTALAGPLTAASIVPAVALGAASVLGLMAALVIHTNSGLGEIIATDVLWMSIGWGTLMGVCIMVFPATAPSPQVQRRTERA